MNDIETDNKEIIVDDDPHGSSRSIIDERFNEVLFKLWMLGKTFAELVDIYKDTQHSFSMSSIKRAASRYGWQDRRAAILVRVREHNDEDLEIFNAKRLQMVHTIIGITAEQMEREYQVFLRDPNKRPTWLPTNVKDIDVVMRLHEFLASGGVSKHAIAVKGVGSLEVNISEDTARNMLQILSEATTQQLVEQSNEQAIVTLLNAPAPVETVVKEVTDLDKLTELVNKNDDSQKP